MTDVDRLIEGVIMAKALLEERGAIPDRVELTRAQYEALKTYCTFEAKGQPDSLLGLRVIVRD